jgi:cephalosporin-C deacetylase
VANPRPPLNRPVDFFEFWSQTIDELDRTRSVVERQTVGARAGLELERIVFASLGKARIHGYLLRWADGAPRPLVVHGHGYGGRYMPRWRWARAGLNVVGVDVRGWGGPRPRCRRARAGGGS